MNHDLLWSHEEYYPNGKAEGYVADAVFRPNCCTQPSEWYKKKSSIKNIGQAHTLFHLDNCNYFFAPLMQCWSPPPPAFFFFLGKHNSAILTCFQVPFSVPNWCISFRSFANLFPLLNHIPVLASLPQPMLALSPAPLLLPTAPAVSPFGYSVPRHDLQWHCSFFFWVYVNSVHWVSWGTVIYSIAWSLPLNRSENHKARKSKLQLFMAPLFLISELGCQISDLRLSLVPFTLLSWQGEMLWVPTWESEVYICTISMKSST